jgi:hypothetical protein
MKKINFLFTALLVFVLVALLLIFLIDHFKNESSAVPGIVAEVKDSIQNLVPNSVDKIKGSTLDLDKSATIGNVFDNYKYFKSVSWEASEDDQKRNIVTFSGKYDLDKFDDTNLEMQATDSDISNAKQKKPDCNFVAQFKIAVDGKSFEIGFCGIHYSAVINGQPDSSDIPQENNEELQALYQNEPPVKVLSLIQACSVTNISTTP